MLLLILASLCVATFIFMSIFQKFTQAATTAQSAMFGNATAFFQKTFGFEEGNYDETKEKLAKMFYVEKDKIMPEWQSAWFDPWNPKSSSSASSSATSSASSSSGDQEQVPEQEGETNNNNNNSKNRAKNSPPRIAAGTFRFDNVAEMRAVAKKLLRQSGYKSVVFEKFHVVGDSRELHKFPGAMYQAASQFNALEFPGPSCAPEQGISGYVYDRTQGPACACACVSGTAYRNYFLPVDDKLNMASLGEGGNPLPSDNNKLPAFNKIGQFSDRQINGLADTEEVVFKEAGQQLWRIQNGYSELRQAGLQMCPAWGDKMKKDPKYEQGLIDLLRTAAHYDVEVTDKRIAKVPEPVLVSQIYCSACSVGYSRYGEQEWAPLACLALKGAYEATMYSYLIHALRCEKTEREVAPLFLTKLGGGVFGNPHKWICDAMVHSQARLEGLFQEVAAENHQASATTSEFESGAEEEGEGNSSNKKKKGGSVPPFNCKIFVTHFGKVDAGYDRFVPPKNQQESKK